MNYIDLSNSDIGLIFKNNDKYKPNADYMLVDFTRKKIMANNTIVHYYVWDKDFHTIDTKEKYIKHLRKLKERHINIICQTDFSAWYGCYGERITAVKKNFDYLQIADRMGFNLILNFNNVFSDNILSYKDLIKDAKTCIFDFNHKESKYADLEYKALESLLNIADIKSFIIKTNKRHVPSEYSAFFSLLASKDIKICYVPTEMSILEIRKKKYYK